MLKKYIFENKSESIRDGKMFKTEEIRCHMFDGKDYSLWKTRILLYLKWKKCDEPATREKLAADEQGEWDEKNLKAMNYIYCSITNEQLKFVREEDTALKIMKKFDEIYMKESTALQICIRNKIDRMRLKDFDEVTTFFTEFEKVINELKSAGEKVTEREKLNYMLKTLPESLSYVGDLIDSLQEEDRTYKFLKNKIIMWETRSPNDSGNKTSNVFKAEKRDIKCFGCGKKGHIRKDCRNPWKKEANGGMHWTGGAQQQQQQYRDFGGRGYGQCRRGRGWQPRAGGTGQHNARYTYNEGYEEEGTGTFLTQVERKHEGTPDQYQAEYDSRRGKEYSRFHGYTYDGIWAVALAIQRAARRIRHFRRNQTISDFKYRDTLWETLFLEALKNTSFIGVTGPVHFTENERKAYILLKQFQSGTEVKVGEYDGMTDTLDLSKGGSLVWRGKSPPKDRTLHIIEHSTVNIKIYALLASIASVGIIMAVVFLAINIRYRNQRYIKMSSPHLNNLIIIGCMFTYSSVIFLGLDSQLSSVTAFPYICTARAWLLMAGFSLAFGSMFSKTWRVHSIFTDVKLNKKVIKDYQLFMVVGVLLFIDLGIMTTWQIADPFYRDTKQMEPYLHPSSEDIIIIPENEYCQSNRMTVYMGCIYAYKGLLMIFGAFLAWETRHVSIPALNDSKYVGMSVYNVVIMCVTGAAISFVLADKQDAMFIMLAVFIIFCSTATLCLVFVPKLIELRRNPQGAIDKRMRPTLRPVSKARRDSTVSELEERLKEATIANQKFRKQLLEKDSELQMFLRKIGEDGVADTQEAMDRLTVPRQEGIIKKEGPSLTTETTDISMSMCSLTSMTVSQTEGDYVNASIVEQAAKKKTSFGKVPTIAVDNERLPLILPSALKHTTVEDTARRKSHIGDENQDSEPLLERSPEPRSEGKMNVEFVPEAAEETDSIVLEETAIPRDAKIIMKKDEERARLPTPPPSKNVSFSELHDQAYSDQHILPPPLQFIPPRHRHSGSVPSHQSLKRRSSVRNDTLAHSHHELSERRRTSVPINSISYISTENVSKSSGKNDIQTTFDKAYVIGECGHRRSLVTGYRCEKHGGRGHSHAMFNGSAETPPAPRRHRKHHDSHNASSPSVPAVVNASYSDTERCEELASAIIQRSVSERSREKCLRARSGGHSISECPHRAATSRKVRECRHTESKLRHQQARLEYVQSTPNVATIHNSKYASGNPRAGDVSGSGEGILGSSGVGRGGVGARVGSRVGPGITSSGGEIYSAASDGELLDRAILLPIFQKLLTERHKSNARSGYGASIASCPNISIKCDIVEYL